MYVLIVEDDYIQWGALREALEKALRRKIPELRVERIATEERFRAALADIVRNPPDVIIMDVMLRWADAGERLPEAPEEVRREGYRRAGVRCRRLIADNPATRDIPVILYTVLEESDLREDTGVESESVYLPKNSSIGPLLTKIQLVTVGRKPPPR